MLPTKEDVEVMKKGLPQITIFVLAWVVYFVFNLYRTSEESRIQMITDERNLFRDLYFKNLNVLQNMKKYENVNIDTTDYARSLSPK